MGIELPNDFKEFLRLLNLHRVEYLLVGGYAVGYHGYPRATNDMDIWIATDPANARLMVGLLREFGFDLPGLNEELFLTPGNVVRMGHPPMRIEVLNRLSGVDFSGCFRDRIRGELDGVPVNIIHLDHLKANKRAAARHKDLDDLEHLPSTRARGGS